MNEKEIREKLINDFKEDFDIDLTKNTDEYTAKNSWKKANEEMNNIFEEIKDDEEIKTYFTPLTTEEILQNPNNIYTKCIVKKKEITEDLRKTITFKRFLEDNKIKKVKLQVKIPKHIQDSQKIVLHNEGNYTNGIRGNLIIEVKIK